MRATFTFSGTWDVPAPVATVHRILVDLEHYPDWWPQVVAVGAGGPGAARGRGGAAGRATREQVRAVAKLGPDDARVLCRSALPYTLDLVLHAVDRSPERLEVAVSGDLSGSVRFDLAARAGGTRLSLAQDVAVSGALGAASYLARPVLRWNHHRMMAGCIAGLRRQASIVDMSP